jgi:glutathione synthase/RimK-type ligase-like ATP-grasp enzyme
MAAPDQRPFTLLFSREPPPTYREKRDPFDATNAVGDLFGPAAARLTHPRVLIVARSTDAIADAVGAELLRRGAPAARLNGDHVSVRSSLAISLEAGATRGHLVLESGAVALDRVEAVFWRLRSAGARVAPTPYESFRRSEVAAAMEDFEALLHRARWIDRPSHVRASGSKLEHLRVAVELGFDVPRTLVTNQSDAAREFVESCESTVVKAFNWLWDDPNTGRRHVIFTHRLRREDRLHLDLVVNAPCIFQEEVPRAVEWRVTVVGERVFAVVIRAAAAAAASTVDWRDPACEPQYRAAKLPQEVEGRCIAVTRRFGLTFAAMDLIETPDGRHVFLDFNPYGNWLHVQQRAGVRITQAVVDLLEHGGQT